MILLTNLSGKHKCDVMMKGKIFVWMDQWMRLASLKVRQVKTGQSCLSFWTCPTFALIYSNTYPLQEDCNQ